MNTNTNTFGTTVGRAVGRIAATTVHSVAVVVTSTGRFGQDVAAGAGAGYSEHSDRLAALRVQAAALRAAPNRYAIEEVQLPARKRATA